MSSLHALASVVHERTILLRQATCTVNDVNDVLKLTHKVFDLRCIDKFLRVMSVGLVAKLVGRLARLKAALEIPGAPTSARSVLETPRLFSPQGVPPQIVCERPLAPRRPW